MAEHATAEDVRVVDLRNLDLPWLDEPRHRRLELAALLRDVGRALDPG